MSRINFFEGSGVVLALIFLIYAGGDIANVWNASNMLLLIIAVSGTIMFALAKRKTLSETSNG